ncbi:ribonucleotide-diphosphate reductase subunit beta [Chitinibacter tainanensis]|uniref:ribonucleotide-diphosphate reductase subunit beta n=1 Tax=Chitinibacter tainanensis TaxID=230667 RepID=UPI000407B575|nr:ribonucleotide-diphosphate reductase subunit beta [Chitinibacter tainanensis]
MQQAIIESVNNRRLIGGSHDRLMCVSPLKHKWAWELIETMESNNWTVKEMALGRDVMQYKGGDLTTGERHAFDSALAFVSNLDGIQFHNLADNIAPYITSPEVRMAISRQTWEEALHVKAYSTIIEAITDDPSSIYTLFMRDDILAAKNEHILAQSAILGNDYSPRNFALAVVSNIALEGIYFYSAFATFYALARNSKMPGTAEGIKLIQRDEESHLALFLSMFRTLREENPEIFDADFWRDARQLLINAGNLEITWGCHIVEKGVMGLTPAIITDFVKWLVDDRAVMLGMEPIYMVSNPIPWFLDYSSINGNLRNFFETKVVSYKSGALDWGDDD